MAAGNQHSVRRILCLYGVAAVSAVFNIPRLPIEVHGFNDLGMWRQVLMKGVRWGKLDFSLCTRDSCAEYSTWNTGPGTGNSSDCVTDGTVELCCICLSGDTGTRPYLFDPFNTSYDLLNFLADPNNLILLPTVDDPNPLMLGMDWGGPSPPQGIETPVIAAFLLSLQQTIARLGLGVMPYGDAGLSEWLVGLDIACRSPQGCSPLESELQSLPWPAESGPPLPPLSQDPDGRYRILNAPANSFDQACNTSAWNGNGALGRATMHPFLWYESTMQIEFESILDKDINCKTLPPNRSDVNTGTCVVSNQAPESKLWCRVDRVGRSFSSLRCACTHFDLVCS
jgi:hypothetical protein